MFDKNLVLIANKGDGKEPEVLFLKANTLTKENHGIAWLTPDEHSEFTNTKVVPKGPIDYDPTTQEVIVITFRGNGQSVFTKLTGDFFKPEKQNKSWAFYDDFIEGVKKHNEAVKAKEAEKIEPVVEAAPAEEVPKKKKRKKKKKE